MRSVAQLGRPSIGHATATGKIVLAFGAAGPADGPLRAYTERTLTDADALARELEQVRTRGWAEATGEREDDLNAIAAPVRGSRGELVAVMGVQGPAPRFDAEAMREAVGPLLKRAAAVSSGLGFPNPVAGV